ncbi:hypothetical protein GCM10012275_43040 [Longimycelium tulufanense]|uniref:Uncharacterized protein n=1 Tax=Longimycelium tulufanense TaxID=907463 RepID=A0A8J3FVF6_9PSEU|nr:hypothetical protein [Longimycelium tulufanense]GGM67838.1 hypothetical protein GCM10012275_43040 [Longimycelium tulufanense]
MSSASPSEPASLDERVDAALDTLNQCTTALEALAGRLEKVEKALQRTQATQEHPRLYRFEEYQASDAESLAQAHAAIAQRWTRLAAWVAWFVRTYRLAGLIPACWPVHPLLVEELKAFRVAWVRAWLDPQAPPTAPVAFSEQVHRFRERLRDPNWGTPRCAVGESHTAEEVDKTFQHWASQQAGATTFALAVHAAQQLVHVHVDTGQEQS